MMQHVRFANEDREMVWCAPVVGVKDKNIV